MKHPRQTVMTGSRLYIWGKPVYYYCTLEKSQILIMGTYYYKQETAIFTLGYTEIKLKLNMTWNYQHPCWEGRKHGRMHALSWALNTTLSVPKVCPQAAGCHPSNLRCWGDSRSRRFPNTQFNIPWYPAYSAEASKPVFTRHVWKHVTACLTRWWPLDINTCFWRDGDLSSAIERATSDSLASFKMGTPAFLPFTYFTSLRWEHLSSGNVKLLWLLHENSIKALKCLLRLKKNKTVIMVFQVKFEIWRKTPIKLVRDLN